MMEKAASGPTVFSVLMELSSTRVSSFATGGSTAQRLRVSMDSMMKTQPRLLQLVAVVVRLLHPVIATVQEVDRQGTSHSGDELSPYRPSVMCPLQGYIELLIINIYKDK